MDDIIARTTSQTEGSSPVLDQSFMPATNLGAEINEGYPYVAQTFTAQLTGSLIALRLSIRSKAALNPWMGFPAYPLRVSIYQTTGGAPSAVELGYAIVANGDAPPATYISLMQPVAQVSGGRYAIVAHYETAPPYGAGESLGVWSGATGNLYPNGDMYLGLVGAPWTPNGLNDFDVAFQTYVIRSGA